MSLGNLTDPLPDPYLAVAEVLILVMAPVMVVLMAAVHACAPAHLRMFSLVAFGWMLVAACLTMTVHVVELVVARRVEPEAVPGFARLFDFAWPSMLYAVDIVAWDLLLGLSLVFAAVRVHRPPLPGRALGSAGRAGRSASSGSSARRPTCWPGGGSGSSAMSWPSRSPASR